MSATVSNMENLTDYRPDTHRQMSGWIGVDFGKAACVEGIRYMLCSGDGCILPGHEYELFCFREGKWLSAGKQTASRQGLAFGKVPDNCLYQLLDHTSTLEGDVFTIENGRIRFW